MFFDEAPMFLYLASMVFCSVAMVVLVWFNGALSCFYVVATVFLLCVLSLFLHSWCFYVVYMLFLRFSASF